MRLKSWVKWLLGYMIVIDFLLITLWMYMLRLIEIGEV